MEKKTQFLPIDPAASRLGVPRDWLRKEAAAGRVPVLRVGRRLLFDIEAVHRALAEHSEREVQNESK